MNVTVPGIVTGLNTLNDGTIKVTLALNEIQPDMAGTLFQLHNQHIKAYITTENIVQEAKEAIDEWEVEIESKSPSKRLRNVLYRLWEQDTQGYEDFELFYKNRMEKLIEAIKNKLT